MICQTISNIENMCSLNLMITLLILHVKHNEHSADVWLPNILILFIMMRKPMIGKSLSKMTNRRLRGASMVLVRSIGGKVLLDISIQGYVKLLLVESSSHLHFLLTSYLLLLLLQHFVYFPQIFGEISFSGFIAIIVERFHSTFSLRIKRWSNTYIRYVKSSNIFLVFFFCVFYFSCCLCFCLLTFSFTRFFPLCLQNFRVFFFLYIIHRISKTFLLQFSLLRTKKKKGCYN